VKVTVRVDGDGVEVDLTGSSPQVPTAFNVPFEGSTKVACYFAFRASNSHFEVSGVFGLVSPCGGRGGVSR
jgi:N-methylhydantoinase B/oxoprolinase/acetone carboxylase alpha subunit